MTREQWARVNALFHEALARPAVDRVSWLAGQTSDPAIAREVLALIAAHESDGAFLESPAVAFGETTAAPPAAAPLVGRIIGAYEVEREIGRGGMGVVYLARDTRLGRAVGPAADRPHHRPLRTRARDRPRRHGRRVSRPRHAARPRRRPRC